MQHAVQPDGRELADHKTFGVVVESVLTIAVTLRVSDLSVCVCKNVKVVLCLMYECQGWAAHVKHNMLTNSCLFQQPSAPSCQTLQVPMVTMAQF